MRRKWSAGVESVGLQFCFVLWVPFCAVRAPLRQACCAPLRHAAQWSVVAGGFAVGTLWWQVRRKWSAGVGGFGLQFCFAVFCACHSCSAGSCCAVASRAVASRCGRFRCRYIVVAGASCVESGARVSGVSYCLHAGQFCKRDYISVQFCLLFCFVRAILCRAVLRCVMLRSGQSLRAVSL